MARVHRFALLFSIVLGAPGCEGIIGLGGYSEGASGDAATFDATTHPHDGSSKADAHPDAGSSRADASHADAPGDAPVRRVECDAASNCKGATCAVAACTQGACVYTTPTGSSCDGGFCNAAGGCVQCLSADACAPSPTECEEPSCSKTSGTCQLSPKPPSAACGDGGKCDGQGNCSSCSGCAPRGCYTTTCTSGCAYEAAPISTTCDAGGSAGVCDGTGSCYVCNITADCPSPSQPCEVVNCSTMHGCVLSFVEEDTTCGPNHDMLCNSSGHCVECTPSNRLACSGGTPVCSDAGACVQCNVAGDCKGIVNVTCTAMHTCISI